MPSIHPHHPQSKKRGFNVLVFDIETTNLCADYGVVLCASYWREGRKRPSLLTQREISPDWTQSSHNDRLLIQALLMEMADADFWVAHNGANFDVPFLYTRAAYWGIPTPPRRAVMDPVIVARRALRLSGNSLENLAKHFMLPRKTPLSGTTWLLASLARDEKAMRDLEEHCIRDVEILSMLAPAFRPLWRNLGSTGAFY